MARVTDANGNLMMPINANDVFNNSNIREWNNDLDRNAFLNLLMTQLRFQDPLNPMDDREFIAQLATFSSLEQMQQLNSTFGRFQAFSMIGQEVYGVTRDSATAQPREVQGTVESVRMIAGEPWLVVGRGENAQMIRATEVQLVNDFNSLRNLWALEDINASNIMNQNLAMVGRYVQALTFDSEGRPNGFIEGKVEYVDFTGIPQGIPPMLVIGNDRVILNEIITVADSPMIIGREIGYTVGSATHRGVIESVRVSGENAWLVIGGEEHAIDRINFVTEALRLQRTNADITHNGARGVVSDVWVNAGAVWVRVTTADGISDPILFSNLIGANVGSDD